MEQASIICVSKKVKDYVYQHTYYWSSADYGDADLLDTAPCESLDQAIVELKAKMVELFRAFSAI